MFQSIVNPEKKFGSVFQQRRYDKEKTKDKERIYCIRHGQTALDALHRSDGWLDLPLNDEGRQNIVLVLAKFLKKIPITCIYAPPLRRTKETAEILKSGMVSDPTIEIVPALKTWNLGSLAGDKKGPNKAVVKDLIDHPAKTAPDGESYNDFMDRFDAFIKKLEGKAKKDGPFLVVMSGSNCRRISEMVFRDRSQLDIDESGLFLLYPEEDGKWTAKVLDKKRDAEAIKENPEVS
jgi:broad specificity phosphatase PhoE